MSLPFSLAAAGSLGVRCPRIPILVDRTDNVLFYLRVPDAKPGDILESVTVEFGSGTDLKSIASLSLFYSGTEAANRKGLHFCPVEQ